MSMLDLVDAVKSKYGINVPDCANPAIDYSCAAFESVLVDQKQWFLNLWDLGIRCNNNLYLSWRNGNFLIFNLIKHYKVTTNIFYISCW